MSQQLVENLPLDLNSLGNAAVVDVRGFSRASVSIRTLAGAAWSTAVVELRASVDGKTVETLEQVYEWTGQGTLWDIDVKAFAFVHLVVTTAEGTALKGRVSVYMNGGLE